MVGEESENATSGKESKLRCQSRVGKSGTKESKGFSRYALTVSV